MELQLPYPMPVNRLYRTVNGRPIKSREYRQWLIDAQQMAVAQGALHSTTREYEVSIRVSPRQNKDGSTSKVVVDLDAGLKAALDALEWLVWEDDKQVKKITLQYGESRPGGGMTVEINERSPK